MEKRTVQPDIFEKELNELDRKEWAQVPNVIERFFSSLLTQDAK
jgi:hypothetical protein